MNPGAPLAGAIVPTAVLGRGWLVSPDQDPLVPDWLQTQIRSVSERLALRWHAAAGCFQVMCRWLPDDPRHAMIQRGEIGDSPWELIGQIPPTVGPEEVRGWIEARLRLMAPSRADLARELDAADARLAAQHAAVQAAALEQVAEGLEAMTTQRTRRRRADG